MGRDCVGALQFLPDDETPLDPSNIKTRQLSDAEIAEKLRGLAQNPLGIEKDEDFRISLAGVQEKTALLKTEDGKWHQTWAGSFGSFLFLSGGFTDGAMRMDGASTRNGKTTRQRITWTPLPDGRVRQHWQQSQDEGKTWTDAFVGIYARRKADSAGEH